MNYWLVKTEPNAYSWDDFVAKKGGIWDGVRNYQARNNLKLMQINDTVLFYHSNIGLEIVGLAKVSKEYYQDSTTENPNWVAVDLMPIKKLKNSVKLQTIKENPELQQLALVRNGRLSVQPVSAEEFKEIMNLAHEI